MSQPRVLFQRGLASFVANPSWPPPACPNPPAREAAEGAAPAEQEAAASADIDAAEPTDTQERNYKRPASFAPSM